jgi:AAA domain
VTYLVSLPNPGESGAPKFLRSDDPALVARWVAAENRPGFGVYYLPNPLKPGAGVHGRDTILEIRSLYADVDLKHITESADEVERRLRGLLLCPTTLVHSGHGFHVEWTLKEPIADGTPEFEAACILQERLIEYLAADPQVRPWSLLRLSGTLNSKSEPHVPCEIIDRGTDVDISELQEFAEIVEGDALLTRKPKATNGHDTASPFIAQGDSVDVEAALAAIHFGNISNTWKAVMGSELRHGTPAEDVLELLLNACEQNPACHADPDRKNWRKSLAAMLTWYCQTEREFILCLPTPLQGDWHAAAGEGKRPKLVWRHGAGLHVRGYDTPPPQDEAPAEEPKAEGELKAGPKAEPKKYRFPLIAFDELRPGTEQSYLIDELFPIAGLALVYGAPKSGKSFWTFDAMMHVTLAWEYRDRAVQQGPVIYCAFEGAHGYHKRGEAFRRHHCLTDERPPMFVIPGRADLIKDHAALIKDMHGQLVDRNVDGPPKVVVLDTLNKSLIGSESKDIDMANYIAAAEAIQKAFGCLVIIVHHHGIEESRPRGHTSLRGAIDVMIRIDRDERNNIIALVEEMRDGPEGAQIASRLVVVTVGEDVKGKPLTSAAVEPTDAPSTSEVRAARLTRNQRTMLILLDEAGPGGLHLDEWNEKAREAGLAGNRRATLVDLRDGLRRKGLVAERNGKWVVIKERGPDL